jgi:GT2 family glycosyltransferase
VLEDDVDHVWFLDSDMVFEPFTLDSYALAISEYQDRILIGPYDWLAPGETLPGGSLEQRDMRAASFVEHDPDELLVADLGAALACFGGNLVWPIKTFKALGGFHPQLHHGRCEDGELGLRAAYNRVPMSFVRNAKVWHVHHPVNHQWKIDTNAIDVPLLNAWHPWVESEGLIAVQKDGIRFDYVCPTCGEQMNSLEYWSHGAAHE